MKSFVMPLITTVIVATWSCNVVNAQGSTSRSNSSSATRTIRSNPVEVGKVAWRRDLDGALQESQSTKKPVLVLFQEVPGCAGCQKFGREVLSNPLLVEAIEETFLPVVVYNNRGSGKDAALLKRFNEPAWNYQVIRFLDASGKDIVPRKDKIWTTGGVATRMIDALKLAKRPVPKYLETIAGVSPNESSDHAAFAMSCFWTGEYKLGKIDGVLATEAGWLDGREVTLVRFDKNRVSLNSLAQQAAKVQCAQKVYTQSGKPIAGLKGGKLDRGYRTASAGDQKRQVSRWTALRKVPGLNAMQLTKINSLAPDSMQQAVTWLSPKQREFLTKTPQQ